MEVGQKVFIVDANYNITESVISKITRSLIRLENGEQFRNSSWWHDASIEIYYSNNTIDRKVLVNSNKNAEKYIKYEKFRQFKPDSHREIKYPSKPSTPKMKSMTPSMDELVTYQAEMVEYEKAIKVYNEQTAIANAKMTTWMETYLAYLANRDGIEEYPQEVRDAVYSMAYEEGHAYGYEEVAIYHNRYAEFAINIINAVNKNK